MVIPLITAPYLSEILGAYGIGKVNYATAVIGWFILAASFGVPRFAYREIAKFRDDRKKTSSIFWNMIFIQFILVIIFLSIYTVFIFNISQFREALPLYLIMGLLLIFNVFETNWLYKGLEEYGYIAVRNIAVKCLSTFMIFFLVSHPQHYLMLAAINVLMVGINNLINYKQAFKHIDKQKGVLKPFYYIKKMKVFFYMAVLIALYTRLNQIFLGSVSIADLAFFVRSISILGIGTSLTIAVAASISSRAAYLVHSNREDYKVMSQKSINYIYLLGIPISVTLFFFAREAMYILGGEEFAQGSLGLQIMAPLSLIITLGSWVSSQLLIPNGLEKNAFRIQCAAVILSIVLNFFLVSSFSYIGAALTWLIVETFLFVAKAFYARLKCQDIMINYLTSSTMRFLTAASLMVVIFIGVKGTVENEIVMILSAGILGGGIYILTLIILREKTIIQVFNNIKIIKNLPL